MIPKIKFTYSWIYQQTLLPYKSRFTDSMYKAPNTFIRKVERDWRKSEKKVFTSLARITNTKWNDKIIKCYVLRKSWGTGFSDPLTISIETRNDYFKRKLAPTEFIDILVHELIHLLFFQQNDFDDYFKKLNRKYKKLTVNARIHIPVHAIHTAIYLKHFSKARLNRDIKMCQDSEDYAKAWEIVHNEGHESIVKEIYNRKK